MAGSINTPTPPVGVGQPLWLLAELTYRCPLHCVFCYNPVQLKQASSELTTADGVEVMRQARQLGAAQLGFSGGEPLVRDDLEELVQEAHRLGYSTTLITSGVGLTPARAQRLKDAYKPRSGADVVRWGANMADARKKDWSAVLMALPSLSNFELDQRGEIRAPEPTRPGRSSPGMRLG